jgi:2'-5' RNA ligase
LERLAVELGPIYIETAGLGIFAGPDPVLYLALNKNRDLIYLQTKIWTEMQKHSYGAVDYYEPDRWVPHITLANGGLRPEALHAAVYDLGERNLNWTIRIDNLALMVNCGGTKEILSQFSLSVSTSRIDG